MKILSQRCRYEKFIVYAKPFKKCLYVLYEPCRREDVDFKQ